MRIQSLSLSDRPYQRACLLPIEEELKRRGHTVFQSSDPLPKDDVDGTIATTYLYLRKERCNKLKSPIFFSEHGVAIVKDGFRKFFHINADYMMQSGPIWEERARYVAPKYKGNLKVGFPKSDELFNNISNSANIRSDVIKELNLDPNEPIIVYAPTYYDPDCYNPGSTQMLETIESLCYKNLLVCLHDFDKVGEKLKGPRYIRTPNKNRYLLAADLLIGDFSSIVLEFAILNKPIVQVNPFPKPDHFYIWRERDYGIFQIGEIANNETVKNAVKRALEDPKQYEFLRKYWVERVFYNLGRASKVAVDYMEEVLK